jgi:hypothetical protein
MFPEKRAAFFRVTVITSIVQRLTHKLKRRCFSMRTVTPGTIHFPLKKWMGKCLQRLAALQLMAIEANVWLRGGL